MKWFLKSAENNSTDAQLSIGQMYRDGHGVTHDYREAIKWLRKAAENGNADAQLNLGVMYYEGCGVKRDYIQAHMWFNLSCSEGNVEAYKRRESCYYKMTQTQIEKAQDMARVKTARIEKRKLRND
ncbi:MAG: sel1 repeat family protein [Candidatus Riflebacteria bacterium]|nr:sel1 repeat family protein [Candidatus Riflebacteria bacterium]